MDFVEEGTKYPLTPDLAKTELNIIVLGFREPFGYSIFNTVELSL